MNFNEELNKFFDKNLSVQNLGKLFFLRKDGVVLYSNLPDENIDISTSVLIGGVWQAANALLSHLPKSKKKAFFRLGFDTTDRGVYVLPVTANEEEYLLGVIYDEELNPGALKLRVRKLVFKLEKQFKNEKGHFQNGQNNNGEELDKKFLFKNISDLEMDELFGSF